MTKCHVKIIIFISLMIQISSCTLHSSKALIKSMEFSDFEYMKLIYGVLLKDTIKNEDTLITKAIIDLNKEDLLNNKEEIEKFISIIKDSLASFSEDWKPSNSLIKQNIQIILYGNKGLEL